MTKSFLIGLEPAAWHCNYYVAQVYVFAHPVFAVTFASIAALQENSCRSHHETRRIDLQWFWDCAIKFTRWQHPAVGVERGLLWLAALICVCFDTVVMIVRNCI